jgi:two pore calcium channel protein 1
MCHRRTREVFKIVIHVIPPVLDALLLLLTLLVFSTWLGYLLFNPVEEQDPFHPSSEYFQLLSETIWGLTILLTTSNYPDIMMPVYSRYRIACLFFVGYLLFGLFFLMNLVLAVVNNSFEEQNKARCQLEAERRAHALQLAFRALDHQNKGHIGSATFRELLDELQHNGYSFQYRH